MGGKMKKIAIASAIYFAFSAAYSADGSSCSNFKGGKCYYNANIAVRYALNQVLSNEWNKWFPTYTDFGGNCTNFVNQAILAGLTGKITPEEVYKKGKFFATDRNANSPNKWYFIGKSGNGWNLSSSWKGAKELKRYADANANIKYKGMHFDFITKDSSSTSLEFSKIKLGDIVFADWTSDGIIDHTMIVTNKSGNSYGGVSVTYQNASGYKERRNIYLSAINKANTVFYVYRPTFYSDNGL